MRLVGKESVMGKTVKKIWPFMWADYKSAEKYLEKMAAKGLMIKNIEAFIFEGFNSIAVYEVTEPQHRKFCIDGFKGSAEDAQHYITMAEDAGWEGVAADYGILIFASKEGEHPTPLQTDWHNEYQQIRKSFWKMDIPLGIASLLMMYAFYKMDGLLEESIFKTFDLNTIYILAFFGFSLAGLLRAVAFYIRSTLAIRHNTPLKPLSETHARIWGMLHSINGIVIALFMFGHLASTLYQGAFSGKMYEMVCCSIIGISLIIVMVILHFNLGKDNKYIKMFVIILLIINAMACFAYCASSCEVIEEGTVVTEG